MDFTGQYQFAGSQPYHQFMPIPPLTPSNSHSASDEYNTSPPEAFEAVPHFDYTTFNPNVAAHPPQGFPGPPTPPNPPGSVYAGQQQRLSDGGFNGVKPMPASDMMSVDEQSQARGGSEEDDLTPAQSRRKAQNRAAQRAFRERKEKHVKDLEAKLAGLEAAQHQASMENERLKRDLEKMSTENEILRATGHAGNGLNSSLSPEPTHTGPLRFSPTDFYSNLLQNHTNKKPSHRIVTSDDGERLLAAGAAWDFIINHELFKKGMVDIGSISERLKNCARCDGQGPVFSESAILTAIEQSVASGSDDLL